MLYSQGIAPYYDLFTGPTDPPDEAASFLSHFIGSGSSLLDVGAGTGVTAIVMAERGINVTALEPDPEMYAVLLTRLARRFDIEGRVTPVPRGAGFKTGALYDLVCCFSVLHLLTPQEQEGVVAHANAEVKSGGKVVLDIPVVSPARAERPLSASSTRSLGRLCVERQSSTERSSNGRWKTHWRFVSYLDGAQIHEVSRTFDWSPLDHERTTELLAMLGLTVVGDFAGYDRQPYVPGESSTRLVVASAA